MASNPYPQVTDFITTGYFYHKTLSSQQTERAFHKDTITYNVDDLAPKTADLAEKALDLWESVGDFTFQETPGDKGDINFKDDHLLDFEGELARTSNWLKVSSGQNNPNKIAKIGTSRVQIDKDWIETNGNSTDSYTFSTYVHEIGHALGLGHPGDYNGDADFGSDAEFDTDSFQSSVMSYFNQNENTKINPSTKAFPETPQIADIFAIKKLYGLDKNARSGDNVYGNNNNTGPAELFNAPTSGTTQTFTIYDRGGTDTLDFSKESAAQTITLAAGGISDVAGAKGALIIAPQSTIENAKGGSGVDTITGNGAANVLRGNGNADVLDGQGGADTLHGGPGEDALTGGAEDDTLIGGPGKDQLAGGLGNDTLQYVDGSNSFGGETVDGGDGQDRLLFDDAGATFDLGGDNDPVRRGDPLRERSPQSDHRSRVRPIAGCGHGPRGGDLRPR